MEYPLPFYMSYPMPTIFNDESEQDRDMEYMKNLYPSVAKKIQICVENECDKLEYDSSMMFDQYPDKLMLRLLVNKIYDEVLKENNIPEDLMEDLEDSVEAMSGPNRCHGKNCKHRNNWLNDLVEVLLYNEMYKRRCRHRNCHKRWYY